MKKFFERIISMLLVCVITSGLSMEVFAANNYTCEVYQQCVSNGNEIYEVTKSKSKLRKHPFETKDNVLCKIEKGKLLSVSGYTVNERGNKWAVVVYFDESDNSYKEAYMYSGNIKKHKHSYMTALENEEGILKVCVDCSYAIVNTKEEEATQQLLSIVDQAVKGDYSAENTTFFGILARVIASELVPIVPDFRDFCYDFDHNAPAWLILLDIACVLPMVSYLKHADTLRSISKEADNVDEVMEMTEYALRNSKKGDVFLHVFKGNGVIDNKIIGGHNLDSFLEIADKNGAIINKISKHKSVDGIYKYDYSINGVKGSKTVYDSAVYTDDEIKEFAIQALTNAEFHETKNYMEGVASNGLWFRFHIDLDNTALDSFYPIFNSSLK